MISDEKKRKIISALQDKGVRLPCSRCGNNNFTLLDGYFSQVIQKEAKGIRELIGPAIPSTVIICDQCGSMSQHALGVLGLMDIDRS